MKKGIVKSFISSVEKFGSTNFFCFLRGKIIKLVESPNPMFLKELGGKLLLEKPEKIRKNVPVQISQIQKSKNKNDIFSRDLYTKLYPFLKASILLIDKIIDKIELIKIVK